MPLFAITCMDIADGFDLRQRVRDAHLAYVNTAGRRIVIAGPYLDEDERSIGSLYIIAVDSEDEARSFIEGDPYLDGGLFRSIEIKPWRLVISNV